MKAMKYLLASALCLLVSTACSGTNPGNSNENETATRQAPATSGEKALVVFFSHAGDNYSVGNIEVGNTKIVADYITELTGADQFEIVTHKYDGMAYKPLCDLAKEELENGELPEFEGSVDVSTFFKKYDLNGKTIIPFTTHEGSGLGRCVEDVKAAYPNANVNEGFSMYGHDVRTGKSEVAKWLKTLGF